MSAHPEENAAPGEGVSSELTHTSVVNVRITALSIVGVHPGITPGKSAASTELSKVGVPPAKNSSTPLESTTMESMSATSSLKSVHTELTKADLDQDAARNDANKLHRAFEGSRCDKSTIVHILANRNATERAHIRQEYNTAFPEDLDNCLSKELSGNLKEAVLLWMQEPANRDATLVKHGLTGELEIAIEVICSRTASQIQPLKTTYRYMFGVNLEHDIENHASGRDTKELLLEYVRTSRPDHPEGVDAKLVDKDAKVLYKDGEKRLGTNEATFIRIFTERSSAHLVEINSAYHKLYGHSLKKAVKNETSRNLEFALLTIIQCAENSGKYFAKALHKAMHKALAGTDEKKLTRIIVSRAEIDIEQIKAEYEKKYRKSLIDVVHSKTSGDYRSFLISLLEQKQH